MMKQEARIAKNYPGLDSVAAVNLVNNTYARYKQLEEKLTRQSKLTQYMPKLDSLATSLKFVENNPQLLSTIKDGKEKLQEATSKIQGLEDQFKKAEDIKEFLRERKEYLKEATEQFWINQGIEKAKQTGILLRSTGE